LEALYPSKSAGEGEEDDDEETVERRKEGREALQRFVETGAVACKKPKPVHVVMPQPDLTPLKSKFWVSGEDSDDPDDDVTSPTTPEFIKEALDAGFTVEQLARAECALESGNSISSSEKFLPNLIVNTMARKKLVGAPWEGPLPSPRVSPPRTLGDCIASAYQRSTTTNGGSSCQRSTYNGG
jgi:hypothetical protein